MFWVAAARLLRNRDDSPDVGSRGVPYATGGRPGPDLAYPVPIRPVAWDIGSFLEVRKHDPFFVQVARAVRKLLGIDGGYFRNQYAGIVGNIFLPDNALAVEHKGVRRIVVLDKRLDPVDVVEALGDECPDGDGIYEEACSLAGRDGIELHAEPGSIDLVDRRDRRPRVRGAAERERRIVGLEKESLCYPQASAIRRKSQLEHALGRNRARVMSADLNFNSRDPGLRQVESEVVPPENRALSVQPGHGIDARGSGCPLHIVDRNLSARACELRAGGKVLEGINRIEACAGVDGADIEIDIVIQRARALGKVSRRNFGAEPAEHVHALVGA